MTFTTPDPVGTVYTLLSTYWNGTTATVTPTFGKKENLTTARASTHVLVYQRVNTIDEIGRGSHVDWTDLVTIEVRCAGTTSTVFQKVVTEVLTILATYRLTPGGSYQYAFVTGMRDESYQGSNWYRKLIDVELKRFGMSKT